MRTPLFAAGNNSGPVNSGTRHNSLCGGFNTNGWVTAGLAYIPWPYAGKFSKLRVRYPTVLTGGTMANDITLQVATVDTLTCQATQANSGLASDLVNEANVSAGDLVNIKNVPTNSPTAQTFHQISVSFESDAAGKSVLCARHIASVATGPFFIPLNSIGPDNVTTEGQGEIVMPCAGTLDVMYLYLSAAPGTTSTRTYTVRKNGADAPGLTYTYTSGASGASGAVTASLSFVAGDRLCVSCSTNGVAPASAMCGIGIGWTPAVDGESALLYCGPGALSASATRYLQANGSGTTGNTNESDVYNLAPEDFTARSLYARLSTAPGGATTRTFTARKNAATPAGALTKQFTGSTVEDHDTSNSFSVTGGDLLTVQHTPGGGTPAAVTYAQVSMVAYISPSPPPTPSAHRMTTLGVG